MRFFQDFFSRILESPFTAPPRGTTTMETANTPPRRKRGSELSKYGLFSADCFLFWPLAHAGGCPKKKTGFSSKNNKRLPTASDTAKGSCKHNRLYLCAGGSTTKHQVHTRYMLIMRVASGLFFWSMVAGLLAFSSRQLSRRITQSWPGPLCASHYFPFLSKRSGRRMPPAERSALYILCFTIFYIIYHFFIINVT